MRAIFQKTPCRAADEAPNWYTLRKLEDKAASTSDQPLVYLTNADGLEKKGLVYALVNNIPQRFVEPRRHYDPKRVSQSCFCTLSKSRQRAGKVTRMKAKIGSI